MNIGTALGDCLPAISHLDPAILVFTLIVIALFAIGMHQTYQDEDSTPSLENTALLGAALLRSTSGAMAPPATPFAGNNLKAQPETFLPCKRDSANIYQDCFRDPLDFRSKATVQRQWSLPSCHPTALELQRKLDAALADVASERTAKEAAEKAAAELQSATHRLQQQLETAQNRADSLQVVNVGLERDLDSARSEGPAREVAYENLKGRFFALQRNHANCRAQLQSASRAVRILKAKLAEVQIAQEQHANAQEKAVHIVA